MRKSKTGKFEIREHLAKTLSFNKKTQEPKLFLIIQVALKDVKYSKEIRSNFYNGKKIL